MKIFARRIFVAIIITMFSFSLIACNEIESIENIYKYVSCSVIEDSQIYDGTLCDSWDELNELFNKAKYQNNTLMLEDFCDRNVFEENYILLCYREYRVLKRVEYSNMIISENIISIDVKTISNWISSSISNVSLNNDFIWSCLDFVAIPKIKFLTKPICEKYKINLNQTGYDGSYISLDKYPVIRIDAFYVNSKYAPSVNSNLNFIFVDNYDKLEEIFELQHNLHCNLNGDSLDEFNNIFLIDEYFNKKVFDENVILFIPIRLIQSINDVDYDSTREYQQYEWVYKDIKARGNKITLTKGYASGQTSHNLEAHYLNDFIIIPRSEFKDNFDFNDEYEWNMKNIGYVKDNIPINYVLQYLS